MDVYDGSNDRQIAAQAGLVLLELADDARAWECYWSAVWMARAAYDRDNVHIERWRQEFGDGDGSPEESE